MKEIHFQVDTGDIREVKKILTSLFKQNVYPKCQFSCYDSADYPFLQFSNTSKHGIEGCSHYPTAYKPELIPVVSLSDAIKQLTDYNKFLPIVVKLNKEYVGVVQEDGSVKVGCQTFTADRIIDLYDVVKSVLNHNSFL